MQIISSKEVLKNKLFTVVEEIATDNGGFEIHRNIIRHPGSAVMMAVDQKDRILLVKQFRLPAEADLWELPAGRLDPGEMPIDAAMRELHEETGFTAEKWTELVSYWPSPGYVAEKMTLFLAEGLTAGPQNLMGDERIELRWFESDEINQWIHSGKLIDGKTIIGYFVWLDRKNGAATRS